MALWFGVHTVMKMQNAAKVEYWVIAEVYCKGLKVVTEMEKAVKDVVFTTIAVTGRG